MNFINQIHPRQRLGNKSNARQTCTSCLPQQSDLQARSLDVPFPARIRLLFLSCYHKMTIHHKIQLFSFQQKTIQSNHRRRNRKFASSLRPVIILGALFVVLQWLQAVPCDDERLLQSAMGNLATTFFDQRMIDSLQHTHPVQLDQCLSVRFRDFPNKTFSLDDAEKMLQQQQSTYNNKRDKKTKWRVGITIVEDNNSFMSLHPDPTKGKVHMYHFLEFLTYAYTALLRLASAQQDAPPTSLHDSIIQVPWIHAPHLSQEELRGSHGINQVIADLVLRQSTIFGTVPLKGLEDNDDITQMIHPSFQGKLAHNTWFRTIREGLRQWHIQYVDPQTRQENWLQMSQTADAVLFIYRQKCDHQNVGQMDAPLSDHGVFPANAWSHDIMTGIQGLPNVMLPSSPTTTTTTITTGGTVVRDKLRICYIDRQNTWRKMPLQEHEWLVQTLTQHPLVDFQQLHMERYSGLEQIQIASTCNVLLGNHGNGLSHEMWMKPGSHVVEYFWGTGYSSPNFVMCYSIFARMMKHQYVGFWRGAKIDLERLFRKDPTLAQEYNNGKTEMKFLEARKVFLSEVLTEALADFEKQKQGIISSTY